MQTVFAASSLNKIYLSFSGSQLSSIPLQLLSWLILPMLEAQLLSQYVHISEVPQRSLLLLLSFRRWRFSIWLLIMLFSSRTVPSFTAVFHAVLFSVISSQVLTSMPHLDKTDFAGVLVSQFQSSPLSLTMSKFPIEQLFWNACIIHSSHMSLPSQSSFAQDCCHALKICLPQHFGVWLFCHSKSCSRSYGEISDEIRRSDKRTVN